MKATRSNGDTIALGADDVGTLSHGYASTIHRAQGLTTGHTYTLGGPELYREAAYVAASRGRDENHLYYVTSQQHNQALSELLHTKPPENNDTPPAAELAGVLTRTGAQNLATIMETGEKAAQPHTAPVAARAETPPQPPTPQRENPTQTPQQDPTRQQREEELRRLAEQPDPNLPRPKVPRNDGGDAGSQGLWSNEVTPDRRSTSRQRPVGRFSEQFSESEDTTDTKTTNSRKS